MPTAQQLRAQIESQLANRIPSALTPAPRIIRETLLTGIAEIDQLTNGGLPRGSITEIIGAPSTGRTTLAMSFLAQISQSGNVCAWIDATDEFDPVSAAANGIILEQLLLVRCGMQNNTTTESVTSQKKQPAAHVTKQVQNAGGHGSNHPRNEVRGLDKAVGQLLRQTFTGGTLKPGTPGVPNIKLASVNRSEQVAYDRLPSRRGDLALKTYTGKQSSGQPDHRNFKKPQLSPWQQIDKSIRVVDLLLQHGGFQAIILDLAGLPAEIVSRIPAATWFRFRSLVDSHPNCLVLLTQHACAKSSAALSLQLSNSAILDEATVMTGLRSTVSVHRQRTDTTQSYVLPLRKPPQRESMVAWQSKAPWTSL